ncbi:MAG: hypothetical protein M1836_003286 [Candelina mexicana]|nr:MAG: hypothetical protein M1836_003286 [Candelina mexicana]
MQLLTTLVAILQVLGVARLVQATQICNVCVPEWRKVNPGIGFDLAMGYGTSAIRYSNGSIHEVIKIVGSKEYRSLMLAFLNGSFQNSTWRAEIPRNSTVTNPNHLEDHALDNTGSLPLLLRQLRDFLQRILGKKRVRARSQKPLTHADNVLLDMITGLKEATEAYLNQSLNSSGLTVSTSQFLNATHNSHVNAALTATGLQLPFGAIEGAMKSAIAAYGIQLCKSFADPQRCWYEDERTPYEIVLAIEYSNITLSARMIQSYNDMLDSDGNIIDFLDSTLGFDNLPLPSQQDALSRPSKRFQEEYWQKVYARLQGLLALTVEKPTRLVLLGEAATNKEFHAVIRDALGSQGPHLDFPGSMQANEAIPNPPFAAAIGSAYLAKRNMRLAGRSACIDPCENSSYPEGPEEDDFWEGLVPEELLRMGDKEEL